MAQGEMSGWQPIETAPKDGAYILLLNPAGEIGIGWMDLRHEGTEREFLSGGGAYCDGRHQSVYCGGWKPADCTHWMPLPAPPAPSEEA